MRWAFLDRCSRAAYTGAMSYQTFRVEIIRRALQAVRELGVQVTDDTAACEMIGQPVKLVHVPGPNPKVTVAGDVAYLETLLRRPPHG